jgi:branched-chain amino acid transport system ATP-binding protein
MLSVEGIDAYYGRVRALRQVTLQIGEGEIVTLIGANGAGKSTALRTISGLLHPNCGRILFQGQEIAAWSPPTIVRAGIAQVPEGRHVWPQLTVWENLSLGALVRRDREGVRADMERMFIHFPRLKERLQQMAGSLSGGEQQMLAIARALMSRPKLLLLDEPSLGLAPVMVQELARVIQEIHRQGTTLLLVEQNAMLALKLADRAYVLQTGQVVAEGTPADLLADKRLVSAYLGATMASRPLPTRADTSKGGQDSEEL